MAIRLSSSTPELALLGKTLLHLRDGSPRTRRADFDVTGSMRRNAPSLMCHRMLKTVTPTHLLSSPLEIRDVAEQLPECVNRKLKTLSANDLRLKVEVIDHGSIIDGFASTVALTSKDCVYVSLTVPPAGNRRLTLSDAPDDSPLGWRTTVPTTWVIVPLTPLDSRKITVAPSSKVAVEPELVVCENCAEDGFPKIDVLSPSHEACASGTSARSDGSRYAPSQHP